jgi:hypothetical protein
MITWLPAAPPTGRRRHHTRWRASARAARIAANAASTSPANVLNSRDTVGSEATSPNRPGWARTTAISAAQSPPRPTAVARSTTTLPGSWTARPTRQGASAADSARSSPEQRIVCLSSNPPDEETSDSRAGSRPTPGTGLRFTYGVPSARNNF